MGDYFDPQKFDKQSVPQFYLENSIFKGKDKTSQLYSVREFEKKRILVSLDKLIDYGDTLNIIQADETNRKVERKDIPLIERVGSNKTGYWKVEFV